MKNRILCGLALLIAPAAAAAQTAVPLPAFTAFELRGGGEVTVRHGPAQRVLLVRGDPKVTRFAVDDGRLVIRACVTPCHDYDLRVEIVMPEIEAAAIRGGGSIELERGFPLQPALALAIQGGGDIDADAVEARDVAASIQGGGEIDARARDTLAASIQGGGAINYCGDPSVASSVRGGGDVDKGCDD